MFLGFRVKGVGSSSSMWFRVSGSIVLYGDAIYPNIE